MWFEIKKDGVAKHDPAKLIAYAPKAEEQGYLPTRAVGGRDAHFPALGLSKGRGQPGE